MTKQTIRVTLPVPLVRATDRIARTERRSRDAIFEAALFQYQNRLGTFQRIQRAGVKAARAAGIRSMRDIDRLVHAVRAERRRARGS